MQKYCDRDFIAFAFFKDVILFTHGIADIAVLFLSSEVNSYVLLKIIVFY
jgi:hypothetical protein